MMVGVAEGITHVLYWFTRPRSFRWSLFSRLSVTKKHTTAHKQNRQNNNMLQSCMGPGGSLNLPNLYTNLNCHLIEWREIGTPRLDNAFTFDYTDNSCKIGTVGPFWVFHKKPLTDKTMKGGLYVDVCIPPGKCRGAWTKLETSLANLKWPTRPQAIGGHYFHTWCPL